MNILTEKFRDTIFSVLPITILVVILHLTVAPLPQGGLSRFIIGAVAIMLGLTLFLLGVELAIQPVGEGLGGALARKRNLALMLGVGFFVGFFINVAEPNLFVLALQVAKATAESIGVVTTLVVVSLGIGAMIAVGLGRIVLKLPLRYLLLVLYGIVFLLTFFASSDFLGIAFDAGSATTGSMTVPFILALGLGVASVSGDSSSDEDAFGLVSVAVAGPVIAVLILAIVTGGNISDEMGELALQDGSTWAIFTGHLVSTVKDVALAVLPLVAITLICQKFLLRMRPRVFKRVLKGFLYAYVGLVLFLTGVNAGFMDAGAIIGSTLAAKPFWLLILVSAFIGMVVILAEPTVHVLTEQIEEITDGGLKKQAILTVLALGVSLSVVLSILRMVLPGLELWHLLLVGYGLALGLTFVTPPLFVGMAFDSGSVSSGPMTATFLLAFAQGVAMEQEGVGLLGAFGVIAMVTLIPMIALQIFGIIYSRRQHKEGT